MLRTQAQHCTVGGFEDNSFVPQRDGLSQMLHSNLIGIRASHYYCDVFYSLCKETYFDTVLMQCQLPWQQLSQYFVSSVYTGHVIVNIRAMIIFLKHKKWKYYILAGVVRFNYA